MLARYGTMKTRLMSSSTVAMAEPKPTRLASPMMLAVTNALSSSRPLRPLLMTHTRSKARNDSITVMTSTTTLIGASVGNTTAKKVRVSDAPSTAAASLRARSTLFRPAR